MQLNLLPGWPRTAATPPVPQHIEHYIADIAGLITHSAHAQALRLRNGSPVANPSALITADITPEQIDQLAENIARCAGLGRLQAEMIRDGIRDYKTLGKSAITLLSSEGF